MHSLRVLLQSPPPSAARRVSPVAGVRSPIFVGAPKSPTAFFNKPASPSLQKRGKKTFLLFALHNSSLILEKQVNYALAKSNPREVESFYFVAANEKFAFEKKPAKSNPQSYKSEMKAAVQGLKQALREFLINAIPQNVDPATISIKLCMDFNFGYSGLDVNIVEEVAKLLKALDRNFDITVILDGSGGQAVPKEELVNLGLTEDNLVDRAQLAKVNSAHDLLAMKYPKLVRPKLLAFKELESQQVLEPSVQPRSPTQVFK